MGHVGEGKTPLDGGTGYGQSWALRSTPKNVHKKVSKSAKNILFLIVALNKILLGIGLDATTLDKVTSNFILTQVGLQINTM